MGLGLVSCSRLGFGKLEISAGDVFGYSIKSIDVEVASTELCFGVVAKGFWSRKFVEFSRRFELKIMWIFSTKKGQSGKFSLCSIIGSSLSSQSPITPAQKTHWTLSPLRV